MDKHIETLADIRKEYAAYDNAHHQLSALDAAIALMRGQSEGLSGKVRDAKFGLAMIEVDCAYFGPHMIGPGDSVRIFVEQKAAKNRRALLARTEAGADDGASICLFDATELESLAKCVLASVTPGGSHIPEGWNVLLDKIASLQQKEIR